MVERRGRIDPVEPIYRGGPSVGTKSHLFEISSHERMLLRLAAPPAPRT